MSAKKLVFLILAVLLAFTALDAVNWYASPSSFSKTQTGDLRTLKGESFSDTLSLEPFQSIVYHLEKPLQEDTTAVLTCYREDYSSAKIEQKPQKGAKQILFQIPLDKYAGMDCYINADAAIAEITVSAEPLAEVQTAYPFRLRNIFIPSAILLAVLCLFIYVKPLNSFIRTVDKKIIDPETRWKGVTVAYIVVAVAALLHHIYVTMYHKYVLTGYTDLGIPLLIFSIITFLFGKLWKDKVTWILLALLAVKYARTALEGQDVLDTTTYIYFMSIYAFFGCYGVGRAISRKYWKPFFAALCAAWTVAALVYAAIGISVAASGVPVKNFGSEWFTISEFHRVVFVYHPVTSGIILSISMFIALLGCFLTKQKVLRLLYIPAALVLFFAGSLTGTRTAYMLSALLAALLVYICLRDKLKPGEPKNLPLTAGKYALLFIVFVAVAAGVAFTHFQSMNLIKVLQGRGLISAAYAEGAAAIPEVELRELRFSGSLDYFFNGRIVLWRNALEVITANARNLFLGQSVYNPIIPVDEIRVARGLEYLHHCHNTLIQTLLENGIPGLALYLAFAFTAVFYSIRLIRRRELPFWQRTFAIGVLLCLAEGLIDNTCHVTYGYPQMTVLYLCSGFTIALGRSAKIPKE